MSEFIKDDYIADRVLFAADEIKRLRAALGECLLANNTKEMHILALQQESLKLRAALDSCIPYIEGRAGDPIAIVERARAALETK